MFAYVKISKVFSLVVTKVLSNGVNYFGVAKIPVFIGNADRDWNKFGVFIYVAVDAKPSNNFIILEKIIKLAGGVKVIVVCYQDISE